MELAVSKGNTKRATIFVFANLKYKVIVETNLMDVLFVAENLVKLDILPQALGLMCSNGHGDPIQNHDNT